MKNEIQLRPSYWVSVSGGKDSLYMLKLILSHPEQFPLDGVVHFELEIDYPFIHDCGLYGKTVQNAWDQICKNKAKENMD